MVTPSSVVRGSWVITFLVVLACPTAAQEKNRTAPTPPDFPIAEFRAREDTARWLLRYDWAAWKSSDEVTKFPAEELQKVLGPEWYCSATDQTWDCYYGKYDAAADRYGVSFHFQSKNGGEFVRVDAMPSAAEAAAYARALYRSRMALPAEFRNTGFNFNVYVRRTAGGQFEVWTLPAGQPDGTLIYGGDVCHTIDASGSKVVSTSVKYNGFRGGKPDSSIEVRLNNENDDIATVGNIFFVLQFGNRFKGVAIVGRRFATSLIRINGTDEAWLHAEREQKDTKKPPSLQPF